MRMIHTFWLALAISVLFVRSFAHIKAWAAENNLQLNPHKTRELIVYRRRAGSSASLDPFLPGATRVTSMRVLGVVLSANLTMGNHLDEILSSSASSIHALRMLRSHGLGSPQLHACNCPLYHPGIYVICL